VNSEKTRTGVLLAVLGVASTLGCIAFGCDDVDLTPIEAGEFTVTQRAYGPDEQQWMIGAQLTIDREAEVAILRYTRDGTTYEVHYTLED
jgi:hypothetical protein